MPEMRVLTVRQPWAWAIIHGGKDVENRLRNVAGAYRGPVAIHASQAWDSDLYRAMLRSPEGALRSSLRDHLGERWGDPDAFAWLEFETMDPQRGNILGVVDLIGVHHGPEYGGGCHKLRSPLPITPTYDLCSTWGEVGTYHLVLANPRPLAERIPHRGALGLRRLDDAVALAVLEQVGVAP